MDTKNLKANFEKNGFKFTFLDKKDDLIGFLNNNIKKGSKVAVGGSVTLRECGILDFFKNGEYNFFDRYEKGLSKEDIDEIFRQSLYADSYFMSTNALIEDGSLYNVDGYGNRIAALSFGPKEVFVIAGVNKIVVNLQKASERVKTIAAPLNAKRLNCNTPCTKTNYCVECDCKERICNEALHTKKSKNGRIHIVLINERLGY